MICAFVLDELVLLTELKIVERTHVTCVIMKLFLWLLQIVSEMVKKISSWPMYTLSLSWLGIFRMVGVVSYKMFAMVVSCKKEDGRETIVDQ